MLALAACVPLVAAPRSSASPSAAPVPAASPAFLVKYCVTCHNQRARTGGLVLEHLDVARPAEAAATWEKVTRKLRAGLMPPPAAVRPPAAEVDTFADALEAALDGVAAASPEPGRTPALHRLNRTEYRNAVRELLAVDVDVASLLPPDDASFGFDTTAAALKMDATRMEQYLSAAAHVSRLALGAVSQEPVAQEYTVPEELGQGDRLAGQPFGTRGGLRVRHVFPRDGEYRISVSLFCKESVACDPLAGVPDPHALEVSLDGERVALLSVTARSSRGAGTTSAEEQPARAGTYSLRVPVRSGARDLAAYFLRQPGWYEVETLRRRFDRPYFNTPAGVEIDGQTIYQPYIHAVSVTGPYDATGTADLPSRTRIFVCPERERVAGDACARRILSTLARRAFRRPVGVPETERLMPFFQEGRRGGTFDDGIALALQRLLVSPEFLFRIERDPAGVTPGGVYRVPDLELASRLSFFLWSGPPDGTLLALASRGQLRRPGVMARQVRRMLADPRAHALVENFAGQWLQLRNVDAVRPAEPLFPNVDDSLRQGFRRETELFVESIMREDRSLLELLTADYTYLNERLAAHYGVPHVKGSHFRRVTLGAESPRRGLLGQGSILSLTSRPTRTSPVLRGKWVLETLLGTPPPPPPANVPPLAEKPAGSVADEASVRQRLTVHRANPICASCHSTIDPLGFALESFDAVGRYREVDEGFAPLDTSGVLPDGTKYSGLAEFRAALLREPDRFATAFSEKLLTYALGRGVEHYDQPALRRVVAAARARDYRFSSVVLGIVESLPFQSRRADR